MQREVLWKVKSCSKAPQSIIPGVNALSAISKLIGNFAKRNCTKIYKIQNKETLCEPINEKTSMRIGEKERRILDFGPRSRLFKMQNAAELLSFNSSIKLSDNRHRSVKLREISDFSFRDYFLVAPGKSVVIVRFGRSSAGVKPN